MRRKEPGISTESHNPRVERSGDRDKYEGKTEMHLWRRVQAVAMEARHSSFAMTKGADEVEGSR